MSILNLLGLNSGLGGGRVSLSGAEEGHGSNGPLGLLSGLFGGGEQNDSILRYMLREGYLDDMLNGGSGDKNSHHYSSGSSGSSSTTYNTAPGSSSSSSSDSSGPTWTDGSPMTPASPAQPAQPAQPAAPMTPDQTRTAMRTGSLGAPGGIGGSNLGVPPHGVAVFGGNPPPHGTAVFGAQQLASPTNPGPELTLMGHPQPPTAAPAAQAPTAPVANQPTNQAISPTMLLGYDAVAKKMGIPIDQFNEALLAGEKYHVDPSLLLGIGQHETQFGTQGQGRPSQGSYILGYGAEDSGTLAGMGGLQQYDLAAKKLGGEGVHNEQDLLNYQNQHGQNAYQATDPGWTSGVMQSADAIGRQLHGATQAPTAFPQGTGNTSAAPSATDMAPSSAHIAGYSDVGHAPLAQVGTKADGTPALLSTQAATALQKAQQALGSPIPLVSAYRSNDQQAKVCADKVASGDNGPCAAPGQSEHNKGDAIDVDTNALTPAVQAALVAAGFKPLGPSDPNHFSLSGN